MNLLLWRHAEADDTVPDLERALTARGRRQAERIARWLGPQLPSRHRIVVSPARRTRQTADALTADYHLDQRLLPDVDVTDYLAAVGWPEGLEGSGGCVVVVGHQPMLGRLASLLLAGSELDWSVKKGSVWWLSSREREGRGQVVLRSVTLPEQV